MIGDTDYVCIQCEYFIRGARLHDTSPAGIFFLAAQNHGATSAAVRAALDHSPACHPDLELRPLTADHRAFDPDSASNMGVYAKSNIPAGSVLGEYCGRLTSFDLYNETGQRNANEGIPPAATQWRLALPIWHTRRVVQASRRASWTLLTAETQCP